MNNEKEKSELGKETKTRGWNVSHCLHLLFFLCFNGCQSVHHCIYSRFIRIADLIVLLRHQIGILTDFIQSFWPKWKWHRKKTHLLNYHLFPPVHPFQTITCLCWWMHWAHGVGVACSAIHNWAFAANTINLNTLSPTTPESGETTIRIATYRSAATVSMVLRISGYWSKTALKWSTLKLNKLQ